MEISLSNYKTVLPKALLSKAEKLLVRECDEIEKGHFVAYVDEGEESYDVALTLNNKGIVVTHSCDCKKGSSFCIHQAALLLQLAKGKQAKVVSKVKTKVNKAEALLEAAGEHELKAWLRELLARNKDIELAFVHHFSAKQHEYTPEEAAQITKDAIKAVVKNKRTIEISELKRIVDLWTGIHAPIVQQYQAAAAEEAVFNNLHAVVKSCMEFNGKTNNTSTKIPKYIEGLLLQCTECLNNLHDETAWAKGTGYFINQLKDDFGNVAMHYLVHLNSLCLISNQQRKASLIERLVACYGKTNPDRMYNGGVYTKMIFTVVQENGLFQQYQQIFKPIQFDNTYNLLLIKLLIDEGNFATAETFCTQQINSNFRDVYNIPYLESLKDIYTRQQKKGNLSKTLSLLLPHTFDFSDFLYISNNMPDGEEKKTWRTRILTRARNASSSNLKALLFCFQLMDHENKFLKMIEYIDSHTPYTTVLQYFNKMAGADKAKLLAAVIQKGRSYNWSFSQHRNGEEACFPELLSVMIQCYTADYLKAALLKQKQAASYYSSGPFWEYMIKELPGENKA
jgi:hypothetical protein